MFEQSHCQLLIFVAIILVAQFLQILCQDFTTNSLSYEVKPDISLTRIEPLEGFCSNGFNIYLFSSNFSPVSDNSCIFNDRLIAYARVINLTYIHCNVPSVANVKKEIVFTEKKMLTTCLENFNGQKVVPNTGTIVGGTPVILTLSLTSQLDLGIFLVI